MVSSLIMWIEIGDDIIQEAIRQKGVYSNDARFLLMELALAVKLGRQLVYVPYIIANPNLKNLEDVIGSEALNILKKGTTQRSDMSAIKNIIDFRVRLTYSQPSQRIASELWINPRTGFLKFDFFEETRLLVENLTDAAFYNVLVEFFLKTKRKENAPYTYYALQGGGVTTRQVLKDEINRQQHWCAVVADSDKHCPSAPLGDTASQINTIFDARKPLNCGKYIMEEVMEIENLIPKKMLLKKHHPNEAGFIFNAEWNYYDIKKGLVMDIMHEQNVFNYWYGMFGKDFDFTKVAKYRKSHPLKNIFNNDLHSLKDDRQIVRCCWGHNVLCELLENKNYMNKLKETIFGDLTPEQQREWEKIGRFIYTWTCSSKALV